MSRLTALEVPTPPSANDKTLYLLLGILNCFIFGLGMIIIGAMTKDNANLLIGVIQLILPFVGWIWGLVWGVLIILRAI